ncbi:hypothetical protein [Arthrobacter bambusae]|uniref:hypothetical protein n=1 Tax=Arthrobacter bambusae TaxID=1338426 RepID=UPI002788BF96|nr:hypothetical protein [Arthrobacter bambusae]MDQ0212561.1 hypothetical protein [Arthrobacter bambusae]MDQ0236943.1 hypothetical protein [Arthrobacter bambusae]
MKIIARCLATITITAALSGCATTGTVSPMPSATSGSLSPTPTPTPTPFAVSKVATCDQLVGPNQDGPLIKYIHLVANFDANDASQGEQLRSLKSDLEGVATHAAPDFQQLIQALWSANINDFKAAGAELLTRCS